MQFSENLLNLSVSLVILLVIGNLGLSRTAPGITLPASVVQNAVTTLSPQALQAHNKYRTLHHSPALNWSEGLAAEASAIAQGLVSQSGLSGRKDSALNLGQNLAKLAGSMACNDAGEIATNLWYSQARNYSYSDPRLNGDTDTFTQVVWKDTKEVGIGCAKSSSDSAGPMYVVALYKPAGNIPKLLRQNVLEPGARGNDPDVYSTLFRRQFEEAKSLGRIQRKPLVEA